LVHRDDVLVPPEGLQVMIEEEPSGPGLGDWAAGLLRAFHPRRWLACLAGLLVMAGLNSLASASLELEGAALLDWWRNPITKANAVAGAYAGASLFSLLWAGLVLMASCSLWCVIGGWIARQELVALWQRRNEMMAGKQPQPAGAAAFLARQWKTLLVCCPLVVAFFLSLAVVVLMALGLSRVPVLGVITVALLLPVVLLINLGLLVMSTGVVMWPLMPVAVAAEWGDAYDAMSRGYSYIFQRPLRYVVLTAIAVGLAWLPALAVVSAFDNPAGGEPALPDAVLWVALALSLSIFWSLEPLVYLHLRTAVDRVDAAEVAAAPGATPTPAPIRDRLSRKSPESAPASPRGWPATIRRLLLTYAGLAGAWYFTVVLFWRFGPGPTDWLDWGLTRWSVSPEGVLSWPYMVASFLAAVTAVICGIAPLAAAGRGRRPQGQPDGTGPETIAGRSGRR
jgi:hypothetical protein